MLSVSATVRYVTSCSYSTPDCDCLRLFEHSYLCVFYPFLFSGCSQTVLAWFFSFDWRVQLLCFLSPHCDNVVVINYIIIQSSMVVGRSPSNEYSYISHSYGDCVEARCQEVECLSTLSVLCLVVALSACI